MAPVSLIFLLLKTRPLSESSNAYAEDEIRYVNAKEGLHIREDPSPDSQSLEVLSFGTEVELKKTKGDWAKVKVDGIKGWVNNDYLQSTNPLDEMEYLGNWRITAYTHTGLRCANENYPTAGYTLAHNSLPFGTTVYIEGVGFRTVKL